MKTRDVSKQIAGFIPGFNSRLGDRSVYQQYFREAYENGYSDGLNGY